MVNIKSQKVIGIIFASLLGVTSMCFSQDIRKDYTGAIKKYNVDFKGIGPKVYFLPPPKSRTEQLIEIYNSDDRKDIGEKINKELQFQRLLLQLRSSLSIGQYQYLINPKPTNTDAWNKLLVKTRQNYDENTNSALLNEAAIFSIKNKELTQAQDYFKNAIKLSKSDESIAQHNLTSTWLYLGDFQKAEELAQKQYEYAVGTKNYKDQANAWMHIALARSGLKNYKEAEQNIIRKAIPLYNKAKDYEGKIRAWEYLAQLYFDQNKYTEAQWFLLQAQELSNKKELPNELAEIEYLLGYSKLLDKNFKIAKKEFLEATTLAKKENNRPLELAVLDKLGEVYVHLKDYDEAEKTYQAFLSLKSELDTVKD
ncbi:tetratricopeptide repeat protein [Sphingobacterium sp. SRCM116780]|uniref:tetratricopeptide repeat protein n=1 Tax=Sphingobacterium sp. SRCM116780 TaxID=2907623 RepID=UPI001F2DBE4F|nr:tetratricopeptide repeat protein [Sphingobacterium sp. SRCM116780]UIR55932.1 tetratricopeptide repeat protein [Sphingobacterium sp. SRCM116780]